MIARGQMAAASYFIDLGQDGFQELRINYNIGTAQREAIAMKIRAQLIGALVVAASGTGFISAASAQSCQELWVERNSYYKEAGYCFKTSRAISYFGNGGCIYDVEASVPLPRDIRARIAEITRIERRMGCN
jgi:YARHG domain